MTLGNGTNIKARETIWIATSNLGQELILGNPSNDGDGSLTPEAYRHLMTQSRDVFSRHFGVGLLSLCYPSGAYIFKGFASIEGDGCPPFHGIHRERAGGTGIQVYHPPSDARERPTREDIMRKVVGGYRKEEGARSLQRAAAEILLDL